MTVITVFLGGYFIILGEITPGELTIFTQLSWALSNPMRQLGNLINDTQRFATSATKVMELYYGRPAYCRSVRCGGSCGHEGRHCLQKRHLPL